MSEFLDALIEYIEARREFDAKRANAGPYEGGYYLREDADRVEALRNAAESRLNEHIAAQVNRILKWGQQR